MKKILITGASSGIGLQLAKDYLDLGHHVIACGRNHEKLSSALPEGKVSFCVFDTQDKEKTQIALNCVETPDIVILNAGSCEYVNDATTLDASLFERVLSTNVMGTVNCLSALLPNMQHGHQLAIVSSSVTYLPLTRAEAYGASKAALDYLARTLAVDLADKGIHVSLIRPGFVETPLTQLNDFPMPGKISVAQASERIRRGLQQKKREINFPFLFILVMRFLSWLPNNWWLHIAARMRQQSA